MRLLPESEDALVPRTDFRDDATREAIRDEVSAPAGGLGFQANVRFIDDHRFIDLFEESAGGASRAVDDDGVLRGFE